MFQFQVIPVFLICIKSIIWRRGKGQIVDYDWFENLENLRALKKRHLVCYMLRTKTFVIN